MQSGFIHLARVLFPFSDLCCSAWLSPGKRAKNARTPTKTVLTLPMWLLRLLLLLHHTQLDTTHPQPLVRLGLIMLASVRQGRRGFYQSIVRSIHFRWQGCQALHGTVKALQVIPNLLQVSMDPTRALGHLAWVISRMTWRKSHRCQVSTSKY